tara:strand:+ start:66 stop:563 length:498 start_codon:yes stop_codon:yes gene_type:complete
MPCYYYKCTTCEYIDEYIVDVEKRSEVQICDECGGLANHYPYFKFRHIGPVFSDAMDLEEQILSRKEREQGVRIRDHRDLKKWERDNKLVRCSDKEVAQGEEYSEDIMSMQKRCITKGGRQHYYDEIDKMDIQETTGWSDGQYSRWKTMTDKAQSEAQSGDTELG